MATDNRVFVDVFRDVVIRVRELYDTNNIYPIYQFGNPKKVNAMLDVINQSATNKHLNFPMILLILDNSEIHGDKLNIQYSTSAKVLILAQSDPNYTSEECLTNVFKAVLHPIYYYLLQAIDESMEIRDQPDGINHRKTDRPEIGAEGINLSGEGKVFSENLDGIEIEFINLEIYRNKCT